MLYLIDATYCFFHCVWWHFKIYETETKIEAETEAKTDSVTQMKLSLIIHSQKRLLLVSLWHSHVPKVIWSNSKNQLFECTRSKSEWVILQMPEQVTRTRHFKQEMTIISE